MTEGSFVPLAGSERNSAIHCAGIYVHEVERAGDQFRIGAFSAGARAVNRNDDWLFRFRLHDGISRMTRHPIAR